MVAIITGRKDSGKTTMAERLANEINEHHPGHAIVIDGDQHRKERGTLDGVQNYTDEARLNNLISAATVAAELEKKGHIVFMAFVAPRKEWRDEMRKYFRESKVIYMPGGTLWPGTVYEVPTFKEQEILKHD